MKMILFFAMVFGFTLNSSGQSIMQATIKRGELSKSFDIYLKPSVSFSQKDESMTLTLAIPAASFPLCPVGTSGVTANALGKVSGVYGIQPEFLVNNFGSSTREVVVHNERIEGSTYNVFTFIFSGTATSKHIWKAGEEQLLFTISFNNLVDEEIQTPMLVNLPDGGSKRIAYWYFQANTLGDITNYKAPFYENSHANNSINGASNNGSTLSVLRLNQNKLGNSENKKGIHAYPNLITNGIINLHFIKQPKGTYHLKLINSAGQVVYSSQITKAEGTSTETILPSKSMAKGHYTMEVVTPEGGKQSVKVIY